MKGVPYQFKAEPWQYNAPGGWYFVTVPEELSSEIRGNFKSEEEGWGRLKCIAKIGSSEWKTAIWFATDRKAYILPLKAEIRKLEKITADRVLDVTIWI